MSTCDDPLSSEKTEFATLTVSGRAFCIEIGVIRETRRWSEVTTLPHSPSYVLGAMNLRGIVIPIVDLSEKLGFGQTTLSDRHVIVIVESHEQTIGLVAESVQEIVSLPKDQIHRPPTNCDFNESCIKGLLSYKDDMLRLIDTTVILEALKGADI